MFNTGYYSDQSPMNTCFKEGNRGHHHKHSHKRKQKDSDNGGYFTPLAGAFPHLGSNNNVFFTLLLIALIFFVKNKSRLYA